MFSKTRAPARRPSETPADAPAARRPVPPRVASLLGPDLVFEGQISGEGELQVEGLVRGEINVSRVVIGEGGRVEGVVRGSHIEVRGCIVGNVEGRTVKLYETASVEGDIAHEQLSIDAGATFEGRCRQQQPGAAAPASPAIVEPTLKLVAVESAADIQGPPRPPGRSSRLSWRPPSGPATQP